jgi:hypothetical protein
MTRWIDKKKDRDRLDELTSYVDNDIFFPLQFHYHWFIYMRFSVHVQSSMFIIETFIHHPFLIWLLLRRFIPSHPPLSSPVLFSSSPSPFSFPPQSPSTSPFSQDITYWYLLASSRSSNWIPSDLARFRKWRVRYSQRRWQVKIPASRMML